MAERVVSHVRYGRGVVRGSRNGGFELRIDFEDGMSRWVRGDRLIELGASAAPKPSASPPTHECKVSRRMLEAFRLGIVPHCALDQFTFGRDVVIAAVSRWLAEPGAGAMLLVGEYGTGKTHLLQHTYSKALRDGFAVAYVEMDPNEAPFHKPKRVYSQLMRTLRFRKGAGEQEGRFREFLESAIASGALRDHGYISQLIGRPADDPLWDWIEGRQPGIRPWHPWEDDRPPVPALYDYTTAANIYCYLISGLAWAAKNVLGLEGLLLLFDEAEAVDSFWYTYQVARSYNFVRALIRLASNQPSAFGDPSECGLDYCYKGFPYPFGYRRPSGLKTMFAFTPLDALEEVEELSTAARIDLEPLADSALKEAFEHICLLYDDAYGFLEDDPVIDRIFGVVTSTAGRTRMFVKACVEALDLLRLNKTLSADELLR